MIKLIRQLLVAIVIIYSSSCNEKTSSDTGIIPQDTLQSYYNLASITAENDFIYPIPFEMGSNLSIGKGVNLANPNDPYITKDNFFTIQETVSVTPSKSTWANIKNVSSKIPNEVSEESFRKSSDFSYIENESDERMALHIYANFKGRFGFGKLSAAMDFVRNKKQYGHLIMFNQEVNVAKSNNITLQQSTTAKKELEEINDYPNDEQRLNHFINKFGSHYISDVTFGSRIFIYAYVNSTDERVKASVSLAFKNFAVNANAGGEYERTLRENSVELRMRVYGGEGTVDIPINNIDQIKDFFAKYQKGEYKITIAPIMCRVVSYRSELSPKVYPNLERLFTPYKGMKTISPYGVPPGTIIAWYPSNLDTLKRGNTNIQNIIPEGWALCDGTKETPDLRDKFILGANGTPDANTVGGSPTHNHGGETGDLTSYKPGQINYNSREGYIATYQMRMSITSDNNLPPYRKVLYIMKL